MTRCQGMSGGGAGRRRRVRLWAALLGLVAAVLVGTGAPASGQGDWDCLGGPETRIGYLFEAEGSGSAPYDIVQVDYTTGAATVVGGTPVPVDGVGFNTYDGFHYAVTGGNTIVRIDSSGNTTTVGSAAGSVYTSGDFDTSGHLWLMGNILPGAWAEIDLVPGSPTYGQTLATGTVTYPGNQYRALGDWTWMTGPAGTGLYGVADMVGQRLPTILFFNTVTRAFTVVGEVSGMPVGIGGVDTRGSFTDGTFLYVYTFTSGAVYRIDYGTRVATQLPQSPGAIMFGDGAQCAAAHSGSGTAPTVICPATTLAPGASVTCEATYVVTAADAQAGEVTNTAKATADNPSGTEVSSAPASAIFTTHAPPTSSLSLRKSVTPTSVTLGDQVTYTYVATNTGETSLSGLSVADTAFSGTGTPPDVSCPATTLAPGASVTCTATYTVTEADARAGQITNTAKATAQDPSGADVASGPASAVVITKETPPAASLGLKKSVSPEKAGAGDEVTSDPASAVLVTKGTRPPADSLKLKKTAEVTDTNHNGRNDPGDIVTWTLTVTNTGSGTLHDIEVADPVAGPVTCPSTPLQPGASMICAAPPYTLREEDAKRGHLTNTAVARGVDDSGEVITSRKARVTIPVQRGHGPKPPPYGGY